MAGLLSATLLQREIVIEVTVEDFLPGVWVGVVVAAAAVGVEVALVEVPVVVGVVLVVAVAVVVVGEVFALLSRREAVREAKNADLRMKKSSLDVFYEW
jgi:CDP-diglyceride synthetase